jgi:hypothetical protein
VDSPEEGISAVRYSALPCDALMYSVLPWDAVTYFSKRMSDAASETTEGGAMGVAVSVSLVKGVGSREVKSDDGQMS